MSLADFNISLIDFNNQSTKVNVRGCSISRTLSKATSTISVDTLNVIKNRGLQTLIFKELDQTLFRGIVVKHNVAPQRMAYDSVKIDAFDETYIMNNRLVAESYPASGGPYNIRTLLISIMAKYYPSATLANVAQFSSSIDEIRFDYEPLLTVLQKLADISGCFFYMDPTGDLHFFQDNEGTISQSYGDGYGNVIMDSFNLEYISTEVVNKLWVIGAKQASIEYREQIFNYDGQNRIYNLGYIPNYVEVKKWDGSGYNTVMKVKEEKSNDGTQDFLYNKVEKNLTIPLNISPIPASGSFKIRYRPTIEIIDFFEDRTSQNSYGLYEKALKSKDIKTKAEARKIARNSLKTNSGSIINISFDTYDFRPLSIGSLMQLKLDRYDIDGVFLIVDLVTHYDLSTGEAKASVSLQGGALGG